MPGLRTCLGCGGEVPPKTYRGNPRTWCSEACRQWRLRHPNGELRDSSPKRCVGCDALLVSGRRLYCGQACRPSARATPAMETRTCLVCTEQFEVRVDWRKLYCGALCRSRAGRQRAAVERPDWWVRERAKGARWTDARRDAYHRRRARRALARTGRPVRYGEIAARDGWVCRLCGDEVDALLTWPDPLSGSLDHSVPLSLGGAHDPDNVQLAHLRCNTTKGARPTSSFEVVAHAG